MQYNFVRKVVLGSETVPKKATNEERITDFPCSSLEWCMPSFFRELREIDWKLFWKQAGL